MYDQQISIYDIARAVYPYLPGRYPGIMLEIANYRVVMVVVHVLDNPIFGSMFRIYVCSHGARVCSLLVHAA